MRRKRLGYMVLWDGTPAEDARGERRLYMGCAVDADENFRRVSFGGTVFSTLRAARAAIYFTPYPNSAFRIVIAYAPTPAPKVARRGRP